jgi:hypothetical protein
MELYRAEKVKIVADQSSKKKQSHQPTRHARHDANKEFQEPPLLEKLSWFAAALLAFTAVSFVCINWG